MASSNIVGRVGSGIAGVVPLLLVMAAVVVGLGSCGVFEPRTSSPISGKEMTAGELVAEARAAERKAIEDGAKAEREAQAKIRQARAEAEVEAAAVTADADLAAAEARKRLAVIRARTDADVAEATALLNDSRASVDSALAGIDESVTSTLAMLEKQRAERASILKNITQLPVVGQALGAAGVTPGQLDPLLALLLGGGGVVWAGARSRKAQRAREDELYDEAVQKTLDLARIQQEREDSLYDEALSRRKNDDLLAALLTQLTKERTVELPAVREIVAGPSVRPASLN